MLNEQEERKLMELLNKKEQPHDELTDSEFEDMKARCKEEFEKIEDLTRNYRAGIMGYLESISNLARDNERLLLEIKYLRGRITIQKQFVGVDAKKADQ